MIEIATYLNGIVFIKNGIEIAFYSGFSNRLHIPYTAYQAYEHVDSNDEIGIPIDDMGFIIKMISEYMNENFQILRKYFDEKEICRHLECPYKSCKYNDKSDELAESIDKE